MPGEAAAKTVILGVGNLLLSDEGVGVNAERLTEQYVLATVEAVDGAPRHGPALLPGRAEHPPGIPDAGNDQPLRPSQDWKTTRCRAFLSLKMSPHQMGATMLFAARLRDLYPRHVVLWGVQPGCLDIGLDLSPPAAARVPFLIEQVRQEIERWAGPSLLALPQGEREASGVSPSPCCAGRG
ncbi:MAG: hydrogenase expression/formation protein [Anaerolineae bacterium]